MLKLMATRVTDAFNALRGRPEKVQVRIITRDPMRLTIFEWRADPAMCRAAREALSNQVIRQMLDVLRTSHPVNYVLAAANQEARAYHQAQCEGYTLALNDLESLSKHEAPRGELEAGFEKEAHDA